MKDKEKAGVAVATGVAFLLGWLLHRCKPTEGGIVLSDLQITDFQDNPIEQADVTQPVKIKVIAANPGNVAVQGEIVGQVGDNLFTEIIELAPGESTRVTWTYTVEPRPSWMPPLNSHVITVSVGALKTSLRVIWGG